MTLTIYTCIYIYVYVHIIYMHIRTRASSAGPHISDLHVGHIPVSPTMRRIQPLQILFVAVQASQSLPMKSVRPSIKLEFKNEKKKRGRKGTRTRINQTKQLVAKAILGYYPCVRVSLYSIRSMQLSVDQSP